MTKKPDPNSNRSKRRRNRNYNGEGSRPLRRARRILEQRLNHYDSIVKSVRGSTVGYTKAGKMKMW